MSEKSQFAEMLEITGITVDEVIDMEKSAALETVAACKVEDCVEGWHWCSGCDCHLGEGNTCSNCD